ncbi:hypothetical protein CHS0354_015672 [Potamilus streckersoni]|uniref:Shugoshin C-terminal domain-containing protein n=1 Tax=Potamilus streckersoni TaxID=2493646 RepID=A0AAE0VZU9_9BIVA|nr:hypothetical protein CHS0354_015672 [Potamilus streckersoni]
MADSTVTPKVDSNNEKNVNVGQSADENAFVTPGKKKKRSLKKIPSRPKSDLNLSKGKFKSISTPKNYSFLNVSVQKQTLRANNRILAQSLAKSREELRAANNRIFQLHREQQDILQENNRLHRVAGLKDEEIETEVQKRLQLLMMDMKTNLREISHHMLKSGEILNELHEKCLSYSRPSVSGSRSLSVGNISTRSSDGGLQCNTNRRSIYCQPSKLNQPSTHDFLPKADELEMGGFSTKRNSVEGHHDMSLIMEQSTLDDTCAELGEMAAIVPLPAVSESAEHPSLQKAEVGLPQRIRIRRNSGVEKAEKPDSKGGNLQSASKQKENNAKEVKHEKSIAEYVEKLEKGEQNPQTSAELKGRANTSDEDKSNYTAALKDNKDLKEVIYPKKRRETFVVPSSVLLKAENHKKEMAATLSNFEPMEFENIDDETITLVSGSPISAVSSENEQPKKQEPGPSGDGENIKSKRETFCLPNPFKPTKEPIRTPPKISSQEVLAKLIHKQAEDKSQEQNCTNLWLSHPEEEVTTFFNTDMEFTAVIDTKKLIDEGENMLNQDDTSLKDFAKIGSSKLTKTGKLQSGTENKKEELDHVKAKGDDGLEDADKERKRSKKEEEKIKGHVELRLAKPGKIVFSASRKQLDGTRMPVPAKAISKTKLKQKKTVIETPNKESNKISSIFDFHDRTPNIKLEQTDHLKQGKSIYDISLNETAKDEPLPSLKEFKDKLLRDSHAKAVKQGTLESAKQVNLESSKQGTSDIDNSTRKGISASTKQSRSQLRSRPISKMKAEENESSLDKAQSNEEKSSSDNSLLLLKEVPLVHVEYPVQMGENIYCLPLKSGSDDEDSKPVCRGRSQSRSKYAAPDNKDDSEAISSRNRSKSRSRLKRAKNESDSDEEWKPSRGRSRSRPRSKKTTLEDGSSGKKNQSDSCRGRSRSQQRPKESLIDSDNEDEAISLKPSTRSHSRSRNKLGLESFNKEEISNENTSRTKSSGRKAEEAEKIQIIEQTANSIVYSLPLKGCSDDEDSIEKSQSQSNVNSRSRSRSRSKVGTVPSESDAAEENDDSKRDKGKRVKSSSSQKDLIEMSNPKSGSRNLSISHNHKTPSSKETRKKSIKEKDNILANEDANDVDILSHGKSSQNLLSVSPNSIFTDVEVHRIQSDDDLITKIDKENNSHSSPTRLQEEKIYSEVEQILRKENCEKFDHCSIPLDKDCSSGATNSDSDSSLRFVTRKRGESLKVDQIEDKILDVAEDSIKRSIEDIEENGSKSVKSAKSRTCKNTAKRVRETDTKDSTPKKGKNKEGKSASKKENSKDEKENQSLKNIRKRLTMLKYSTSKIILQDCSKKQHSNVKESPSSGIRRTADTAFETDINFTDREREEEFKKPRRAASAVVSYVLPNMRKKLRREDVISNTVFKAPVHKSPSKDEN